jgi:hypothetical protein
VSDFKEELSPTQDGIAPASNKPYDPSQLREQVRLGLVVACMLVLLALLACCYKFATNFSEFKDLLVIVFGPIVAIVSSVVAFYFAERKI